MKTHLIWLSVSLSLFTMTATASDNWAQIYVDLDPQLPPMTIMSSAGTIQGDCIKIGCQADNLSSWPEVLRIYSSATLALKPPRVPDNEFRPLLFLGPIYSSGGKTHNPIIKKVWLSDDLKTIRIKAVNGNLAIDYALYLTPSSGITKIYVIASVKVKSGFTIDLYDSQTSFQIVQLSNWLNHEDNLVYFADGVMRKNKLSKFTENGENDLFDSSSLVSKPEIRLISKTDLSTSISLGNQNDLYLQGVFWNGIVPEFPGNLMYTAAAYFNDPRFKKLSAGRTFQYAYTMNVW